jgi:hypothetical protein
VYRSCKFPQGFKPCFIANKNIALPHYCYKFYAKVSHIARLLCVTVLSVRSTWRSLFFLCSWTFCTLSNCWINLNTQHFKQVLECSTMCRINKSQLSSSLPEYIFSMQYFLRKSMLLFPSSWWKEMRLILSKLRTYTTSEIPNNL